MFYWKSNSSKESKEKFMRLLSNVVNKLYKIAYSYFKNDTDASDAVQDTVLIAYKKFKSLKDENKFDPWITTILVHRCREILRKNKKIVFEQFNDSVIKLDEIYTKNPCNEYLKIENKLDIKTFLEQIDEKYKEIIMLKYIGDYTLEQIAEIMNIPLGTVKSRLNFGIGKLKALMEVNQSEL